MVDYKIKVEQGEIEACSVVPIAIRENSLVFAIDCKQKRPGYGINFYTDDDEKEVITVYLYAEEETLHKQPGGFGMSLVKFCIEGKWHAATEYGKYGPTLYLIRKMERPLEDPLPEDWPYWEQKEGDDNDQQKD